MNKTRLLLNILACLCAFNLSAQINSKQADKLYKDLAYKASIPHYQKIDALSVDQVARVANSYRLNHETHNAERWYAKLVEKSSDPIYKLYYAQSLQNNEKYDLAKQYYLEYDKIIAGEEGSDKRGELLAAAIDRMAEFNHSEATVVNLKEVNTHKLDFSPSYYDNGIVFISSRRNEMNDANFKDSWIDDNFMSIFHAPFKMDGGVKDLQMFSLDLTTKYHEGPVSFTKDGHQIFFTRNDYLNGKIRSNSKGIMKLQIYTAEKTNKGWSEPVSLPFNTQEHEEAHPSINAKGDMLFFTSDRPGGMGGMDIYMSRLVNGAWSAPVNLGEEINTAGNEVFPYINDDNTLYFASNGLGGIGGLDIFSTKMINLDSDNQWTKVENIGTPFNSPKDDFGYISNTMNTEGYFTSARDGGVGKDDIYHFKRKSNPYKRTTICAFEEGTDQRLEGVVVDITLKENMVDQSNGDYYLNLEETEKEGTFRMKINKESETTFDNSLDKKFSYLTDKKGQTTVSLLPNKKYIVHAKKNGYTIGSKEIILKDVSMGEDFCIPLEKSTCTELAGVVKNKKFLKVIPKAEVTIINLCTGEEEIIYSDASGNFEMPCLECGCEYHLVGTKKHFENDSQTLMVSEEDCAAGKVPSLELLLTPNIDDLKKKLTADKTTTTNNKSINTAAPTFEGKEITEGTVIELKNIYYDFDQSYIREDASKELIKVVEMMKAYPSMVIELGSHTDARGKDIYNENLSQRRAQEAINYLIKNGIDSRRLTAMGYGENKLRNGCVNFKDCTEEQHQYNRRTEIKVVSLGSKSDELDVHYINNSPEKIDRANPNRVYSWE